MPAPSPARAAPPGGPTRSQLADLGRLAGGVAHEFNNLLTAIQIHAGLLLERLPPEHPARPSAQEIRLAAEQGALLVEQLSRLSRRQPAQPQVVDLDRMIAGLAEMLQHLIGEHIRLRHQPASRPARVRVDPAQLRQVILNLVLNARDAMPSGGCLTLATSHHEIAAEQALRHPGLEPGPCVRLAVADTGSGVDALARRHLFEPYFTTKPPGRGSGLGLPAVYGLVQQNRGSVWLESEPGQGTTVYLLLPVAPASSSARAEPEAEEAAVAGGSETILLVEDAEVVRRALAAGLAAYGYRVLEAADGPQALRLAAQHPGAIDLVLTDVVLPGLNGRELAWRMDSSHAGTPVLYISGYGEVVAGCPLARPLTFAKPFDAARLARQVRRLLAGRRRPGKKSA
ncbi:MAG TPA: ATP-binding protein [Terriglobales bacterium]|nr:ATP-binding protein [Terriglobales bacterium]